MKTLDISVASLENDSSMLLQCSGFLLDKDKNYLVKEENFTVFLEKKLSAGDIVEIDYMELGDVLPNNRNVFVKVEGLKLEEISTIARKNTGLKNSKKLLGLINNIVQVSISGKQSDSIVAEIKWSRNRNRCELSVFNSNSTGRDMNVCSNFKIGSNFIVVVF